MNETIKNHKESVITANNDAEKLELIINYLKCLHKIQFSALILQATHPSDPLHQSLAESVRQEGEEWFQETQASAPRRKGIRFPGDLSQLFETQDGQEG